MGLAFFLLFCGAEILLRIALQRRFTAETDAPLVRSSMPELGYQLAPNWKGSAETDPRGLRARPADAEEPRHRVLLIGDSVTFGSGVKYEQSYGPILEKLLSRGLGKPVAVWNGGVPGYNATQEAAALRRAGPLVKPDLVVAQICMNDYMEAPVLTAGGTLDATHTEGGGGFSLLQFLYRSRVFVLLKEKLKDRQKQYPERFPKWLHYIPHLRDKPGWIKVRQSLLQMRREAAELDTRLLVVVFPVEEQLRIPDHTVQDDLREFAKQNDIELLDLYDTFRAHWREDLYVDYWEQAHQIDKLHPNARGHELAAKTISSAILSRLPPYFTP